MSFSDPAFLFLFLPLALILITLTTGRWRNGAILAASLGFYFWGSGLAVLILVFSILFNWGLAHRLAGGKAPRLLAFGASVNLLLLGLFKYAFFFAGVLDGFTGASSANLFMAIALPVGISFFTFQAVSYLADVHRGDTAPERDIVLFGAYLSFFPQLVAGPIVRFRDVASDYRSPVPGLSIRAGGAMRFVHGLAKKVLIADPAGAVADACFAAPPGELGMAAAWLGVLAYTIQIYFDFSGYSDMAIGLGRMCGIRFLENFERPYSSSTLTEFWRRWHISLSSWFRDYLYIPLGGNRLSALKTYRNLFIVFAVTGLWHGAAWQFVVWGLYHGAFLAGERWLLKGKALHQQTIWLRFFYLLPAVMVGWVFFRADDLASAMMYLGAMAPAASGFGLDPEIARTLTGPAIIALVAGSVIFLLPRGQSAGAWLSREGTMSVEWLKTAYAAAALILLMTNVLSGQFSPFLYFRF